MKSVLIVEDQAGLRRTLELVLQKEGFRVASLASGERLSTTVQAFRPDVVITDLRMEPVSGMEVLQQVRLASPATEVIMMTAFGTIDTAVEAMKLGAVDYITKPFTNDDLVVKVKLALERRLVRGGQPAVRRAARDAAPMLVAKSRAFVEVLAFIERIAPSDLTVLITGETGTGKTAIARTIHARSKRASGPFIAVSTATLPEPLLESELFGHEKGAFTGAAHSRKGLVEEAHGGTLFLDEIGALPANLQSKLLAVLQDREVRRLGSNRIVPIDVRVIAATNSNLDSAVARGEFRHDLFYRLNVARIHLPPLRERRDDIPHLLDHFLAAARRVQRRDFQLAPEALDIVLRYHYPGNVRELENAVEWMTAVAATPTIRVKELPEVMRGGAAAPQPGAGGPQPRTLDAHERELIIRTIAEYQGNLTEVARVLGIGRTTLWRKMREYSIQK